MKNDFLITCALAISFPICIWFCGYLQGIHDGAKYKSAEWAFDIWKHEPLKEVILNQ